MWERSMVNRWDCSRVEKSGQWWERSLGVVKVKMMG